jgi:PhnB protein
MAFIPYLNFDGDCRDAFTRYQEIFGGELEIVGMGDMPEADQGQTPPEMADMVMNATLTCEHGLLLGSDGRPDEPVRPQGMYAHVGVTSVEEANRIWEALGEGTDDGAVEMPLTEVFWSPAFGIRRDRFGTPWMVNTEPAS